MIKIDRHVVIFRYFLSNINSPVQYPLTQIDLVEFHRIIFKFSLKFAGYARRSTEFRRRISRSYSLQLLDGRNITQPASATKERIADVEIIYRAVLRIHRAPSTDTWSTYNFIIIRLCTFARTELRANRIEITYRVDPQAEFTLNESAESVIVRHTVSIRPVQMRNSFRPVQFVCWGRTRFSRSRQGYSVCVEIR